MWAAFLTLTAATPTALALRSASSTARYPAGAPQPARASTTAVPAVSDSTAGSTAGSIWPVWTAS